MPKRQLKVTHPALIEGVKLLFHPFTSIQFRGMGALVIYENNISLDVSTILSVTCKGSMNQK